MSGLPGAGKSALAEALGRALPAPVLSVDPVEAALWRAGIERTQPTGLASYVVVETLAGELLRLGQTVIVDAVNHVEEARAQWRSLAATHGVPLRFVEVTCSDRDVHRRRLAGRRRDIPGFVEPAWESVEERRGYFTSWDELRLVVDSVFSPEHNLALALADVEQHRSS